jgi:hypothetical protein
MTIATDSSDTVQLLTFLLGVNNKFDVVRELLSTDAVKGTIIDKYLYRRTSATVQAAI